MTVTSQAVATRVFRQTVRFSIFSLVGTNQEAILFLSCLGAESSFRITVILKWDYYR